MAFPVIEATNTSTELVATTSHTVSLPAGIVSGNLLVVVFGRRQSFAPIPAGWSRSAALNHSTNADVADVDVLTRTADGTEGSTLAVTTNDSRESAHAAYRISGWDSFEFAADAESSSTSQPDPPSLTPSGGADDYLWLAICGTRVLDVTGAPTNYGSLLNPSTGSSGVDDANIGLAARSLNASVEDPGAFTASGTPTAWVATTMAVFPTGAAPNAPTGVTASNPTTTTVDLAWTDTNSATAFPRMYRRITGTGPGNWTFVEQLASAAATTYTFTGLDPNTSYDLGVSYTT